MYTRLSLERRGWTPALVRKYLREPDLTGDSPSPYHSADRTHYYYGERVAGIEKSPEFRASFLRSIKLRKLSFKEIRTFLRNRA